jgi:hypothetical protein
MEFTDQPADDEFGQANPPYYDCANTDVTEMTPTDVYDSFDELRNVRIPTDDDLGVSSLPSSSAYGISEHSVLEPTEILPPALSTADEGSVDPSRAITDGSFGANAREFVGMPIIQQHKLDNGEVTHHDHPDQKVVEMFIDELVYGQTLGNYTGARSIDEAAGFNHLCREQLATLEARLEADFGGHVEVPPVKVIGSTDFIGVYPHHEAVGVHIPGEYRRLALRADETTIQRYGPDYVLGIGLREGTKAMAGDSRLELHTTRDGNHYVVPVSGYLTFTPEDYDTSLPLRNGSFWQEGLADNYRVRVMEELGKQLDIPADDPTIHWRPGDRPVYPYVEFVPNDTQPGYQSGVTVPAKYLLGGSGLVPNHILTKGVDIVDYHATLGAMPAYAIDLMDRQVPGLADALQAGLNNPAARADFIAMVNSIEVGLYQRLHELPFTYTDFMAGLLHVQRALGIHN